MPLSSQLKALNLPPIYAGEGQGETIVSAKLFALASAATWLVFEYDPEDMIIFGYCDLYGNGNEGGAELGYTSIEELEELRYGCIPRVELDRHFTPRPLEECLDEDGRIRV